MHVNLGHLRQIALSCTDLRRSIEFYQGILGIELIREFSPPGLAFFRLGATRLMIEQHSGSIKLGSVLYFQVDDVSATQAALEVRGVRFESQPHLIHRDDDGTFGPAKGEEWMTFFKDPDGNLLALAEHRLPAEG